MASASKPISTSLIPYDPTLPHVLADQGIKRKTDAASRKVLEEGYLSTHKALHLGGEETLESRMIRSAISTCQTHSDKEIAQRFSKYTKVAPFLNRLTDGQLSILLTTGKSLGSGTGGEVLSMEVRGVPLFVKKIRLTAIEQENPGSTQNLFDLPSYYQYGVGSMGFGVWREIAAHKMTTQWVLNGECQNFPLMYHSRILQRSNSSTLPTSEQLQERENYIGYWDGSEAVGIRAKAADTAPADVVVFMEHLPQTLDKWLGIKGSKKHLPQIERELNQVTVFMKSRGFLHFDAHLHNILTNNNHVYFADFGLAISQEFDLSLEERAFFEKHIDYDRYYVASALAQHALSRTVGDESAEVVLNMYLSSEKMTILLPPAVESLARRYKPIAILMGKFFQGLREQSKSTPYPVAELAREWTILKKS
jgi:hypothetical protein